MSKSDFASLPRKKALRGYRTCEMVQFAKGFWFIQPDQGSPGVFVHIFAVQRSGLRSLADGQKISYELVQDKRSGTTSAGELRVI